MMNSDSDIGLIPLDDSISGFSPEPSFYVDLTNKAIFDPTIYREKILNTGALGSSSFKFKPTPSKRFSRRDKYGEFSVHENPVVSTKLEIAENEVFQLRSELADRENEFLDKFKLEQLRMEERRRKVLELRAAETLKAAHTQAEISKLRREARERDERRRLEAERIAELKRLAEEEARLKAESDEKARIQAIKDQKRKQMEENEYNTRLMQLQNDQRLMAEEDKRSRAYQEQYEMARLMGLIQKKAEVVPTSRPVSSSAIVRNKGPSEAELLRRAKMQQLAHEMREKKLMEEEDALSRIMDDEYKLLAMQEVEKKKSTVEEKVAYLLHRMDVAVTQFAKHPRRVIRKSVMPPVSSSQMSGAHSLSGLGVIADTENPDILQPNELMSGTKIEDAVNYPLLTSVDEQFNNEELRDLNPFVSFDSESKIKPVSVNTECIQPSGTITRNRGEVMDSGDRETVLKNSLGVNRDAAGSSDCVSVFDERGSSNQGDIREPDGNFSEPDLVSTPVYDKTQQNSSDVSIHNYNSVEPSITKKAFRAPWKIHEEDGLLFIPFTFSGDINFDPFGLLQPAVTSSEPDVLSDDDDADNLFEIEDTDSTHSADAEVVNDDSTLTWPAETIAAWPEESLISCGFYDVLHFKDIIDEDHHYYHVMNFQDTIDTDAFYQKLSLLRARHQKLVELMGSNFMNYEDDDNQFEKFNVLLTGKNVNASNGADNLSDFGSTSSADGTLPSGLPGRVTRQASKSLRSTVSIAHIQTMALYNALDKIPNIDAVDENSTYVDNVPLRFESLSDETRSHFKRFRVSIDKLEIRKVLTVSVTCDFEESTRSDEWIVELELLKVDENGNNSDLVREDSDLYGLFSADQMRRHRVQNKRRYIARTHCIIPAYVDSLTQQAGITNLAVNLNGCLYNDLLVDVFVTRKPPPAATLETQFNKNELGNPHVFRGYAHCTLFGGKVLTDSNEGQRKAGQLIRKFAILSTYNMSELFEKLDLLEASAELTTKDGEPYQCEPPTIVGKSCIKGGSSSSRRKKKVNIAAPSYSSVSVSGKEAIATAGNARKLFFSLTNDLDELNPETKKAPITAPLYTLQQQMADQTEFLSRLSAPRKLATIDPLHLQSKASDIDANTRLKKVNLKASITPATEAELLARLLLPRKKDTLE